MTTDSIFGILEGCCSCSRAEIWELDAEENILEFESSFFLKNTSIVFDLLMMQPKTFQKHEKFIYLLVLILIIPSLSNDIIIKLLAI
jgi:hypothetical protein